MNSNITWPLCPLKRNMPKQISHTLRKVARTHATRSTVFTLTKQYSQCLNCKRHPWYPNIPAVTMHSEGICVICGTLSAPPPIPRETNLIVKTRRHLKFLSYQHRINKNIFDKKFAGEMLDYPYIA